MRYKVYQIVSKHSPPEILMTPFPLESSLMIIHPIEVLNQPAAGYVLDLAATFRDFFAWPLDQDCLCGLLTLAQRHFPASSLDPSGDKIQPSQRALILRLQAAGDLTYGQRGFSLTIAGEKRRRSAFRAALTAPEWLQTLELIQENLKVLAETEGLPLAVA